MKLYLVRHGKTKWNKLGLMQGTTDIPLDLDGIVQAMKIKESIKEPFDVCFVSPLKRAIKTAEIITNCPKIIDESLIERKMGELEGTKFVDFEVEKYWDWQLNLSDRGIESVQDLFARCDLFLKKIKKNYKNKTVLVVSHGATIRALNYCIKGFKKTDNFLEFDAKNCVVFKYEI